MKSELWTIKCEVWTVKFELWSLNFEVWSMNCEVWTLNCEVRSVNCEVGTVKCEQWTVKCELCSVKCKLWTEKCALWTVNCEVWSVKFEAWSLNCELKRPRGRAVSAPDFGSRGLGFEYRWMRDSVLIYTALHCTHFLCSSFHRPDMTEILLNWMWNRKSSIHELWTLKWHFQLSFIHKIAF